MDRIPARWAPIGLGAVLLTLAGFALWAAFSTSDAARVATNASRVSVNFSDARYALSQEGSLQQEYHLEPSQAVRDRHAAAARDMVRALESVRTGGSDTERASADAALRRHQAAYLSAVQNEFGAVDRGVIAPVLAAATSRTERLFTAIEDSVDRSAEQAAAHSEASLRGLQRTERLVVIATPIAFLLGMLVLSFFTSILISALRRSRRQVDENRHNALHDALTGLPNRVLLNDRLSQALRDAVRENTPVAALVIDLDRFKEVNDTLGHAVGDELLVQAGSRLQAALRERDTVARMGGDEFAVVLPDTGAAGARRVVTALAEAFDEPFDLTGLKVYARASIGVACFPDHGADADVLLQRADIAMYLAKGCHAGHALYRPEDDPYDPDHLTLVGELRRAISDEELVLHYQPKLDLRSNRIVGVEALVRWAHPTRGTLNPSIFVPLAEHAGMMRPLTLWVLERTLGQCRLWMEAGREFTVAVNLSVQSLLDSDFASDVARLLDRSGVPPRLLCLEITEGSVMDDPDRSIRVLTMLRDMGVGLSIDDFGTGYSSLAYLTQLPVHEIKIDKGFVMGMDTNRDHAIIVRSTIDLARNLGLGVVAEGVETEQTLRALRELGCDSVQGFLLGRPLPAEELEDWLATEPGQVISKLR